MGWLGKRLGEKSTWRGLIALLAGVGITLSPALTDQIVALGLMIAGGFEAVTKDE